MNRDCPSVVILTLHVPALPPNEPDGWQRLRKLLKALIRSYGMRCESIEPKHQAKGIDDETRR
jgi:hypothetical protein